MRRPAFLLAALLLAASAHAAQPGTPTPTTRKLSAPPILADNPPASQTTLSDIAKAYDSMEQSLEMMFAKLIQEAKGNKDALEDQIKNIDKSIGNLKQEAKNIELVLQRVGEIDARRPSTARLAAINSEINSLEQKKKALKNQIAALDKEIQKLEADKTKEVAELRRQRQKAIDAATKTLSRGASAAQQKALLDAINTALQAYFNELSTRYRAGARSSSAR